MSELPERLREHLLHPSASAEVPAGVPVGHGEGANAACGDVLHLRVWRAGGGLRASFRASACSGVMACASLLCELLEGATEPLDLDLARAVEERGGLPRSRAHSVRVCERALEQALRELGPAA